MTIWLVALFSLAPVAYWWRFKETLLDRDFAPYAYPAWQHSGYLLNGHVDIKPPLIAWLYKIWLFILPPSKVQLKYSLRLMPLVGHVVSIALIGVAAGWQASLIAALLLVNPYLWPHMANTEWIGVLCIAGALNLHGWPCQLALGMMWIANLKNIPLALCIGLYLSGAAWPVSLERLLPILFQFIPLMLSTLYLTLTGRLKLFWKYAFTMMLWFGKTRSWRQHIDIPLISKPLGIELLPFFACLDYTNPWAWLAVIWMVICFASKQVVPHHLLMLVPLLALGCHLTGFLIAAYGITVLLRHYVLWSKPELLYKLTFGNPMKGTDYGIMLKDAQVISEWIKAETKPDEVILVNGIDNNIYTDTGRRAYTLVLPEWWEYPKDPPRIVIHCFQANPICADFYKKFNYGPVFVSKLGLYTVMERGKGDDRKTA
jgi:hypothetical protein